MKSCWQIRQELPRNGGEWRTTCPECRAYMAGISCWELNAPCCCAPVHVTCDFCKLYIFHRNEIISLTQDGCAPRGSGAPSSSSGRPPPGDDDRDDPRSPSSEP